MFKKGITLMYDAIFMCIILFLSIAIIAYSIPYSSTSLINLQDYATSLLIWMDSKEILAPLIYEQNIKTLSSILDKLCPEGYRLEVYSINWNFLWSYTSPNFDYKRASASQAYFLSGYKGFLNPIIVILLLSS
ncbi:MAG: hypothetical protein QXW62_05575 [Candidatus Methanomethylicaceae archaeon]|nr:hypothetical protein [Candidatus Verstraetearchaeota archaeon]